MRAPGQILLLSAFWEIALGVCAKIASVSFGAEGSATPWFFGLTGLR
jgi:hypothetical protein